MGYIALSPTMPQEDRDALRESITRTCMTGMKLFRFFTLSNFSPPPNGKTDALCKSSIAKTRIFCTILPTGYSRPSSTTSHALEKMDNVLIDIKQMEARRDKLYDGLSQQGYDISKPEGKCWLKDPFPRKLNSLSTL